MLALFSKERKLPTLSDEQLRPLAAQLASAEPGATIAFCAGSEGEGVSTVLVNLARALETAGGRRVLIADLNVANPRLHACYGLPRSPGASDVLAGTTRLRSALYVARNGSLAVLPAGNKMAMDAARMFAPDGLPALLLPLRSMGFDIVLVDLPSLLNWPEAVNIAARCTQTLIVLKAGASDREDSLAVRARLAEAGANVTGVVLSRHSR